MPVATSYPGVYVEEIPSGVHTITGVSTAVAAFFGRTTKGPFNKAERILSLSDYQRVFGDPHPQSDLGAAVRLFFQNGGTDCYVVRLYKKGTADTASVEIKNEAGTAVLKFAAKEEGLAGNELAVQTKYNAANPEGAFDLTISRIVGDTVKEIESFSNLSMDKASSRYGPQLVTQSSKLAGCSLLLADAAYNAASAGYSLSRRPIAADTKTALKNGLNALWGGASKAFRISVDGSSFFDVNLGSVSVTEGASADPAGTTETANDAKTKIKAAINGVLPAGLLVAVDLVSGPAGPAGGTMLLKIISDTAAKKSVTIQQAAAEDLAGPLMLGIEQGGIEAPRYSGFRPAPNGTVFNLSNLDSLAALAQNDFSKLTIDGKTVDFGATLQTGAGTDKWFKDAYAGSATGNSDGVREKLNLMAKKINDENVGWTAEVWGYRLALIPKSGINNYSGAISTSATDHSAFFLKNVRYYSLGVAGTGSFQQNGHSGKDGAAPEASDYQGSQTDHTGFYALDLVDIFNIMVIPRDGELSETNHRSLWGPASAYCQAHRAFLIVDAPASWSDSYTKVTDPGSGINNLRVGVVKTHSAVFYPGLKIQDNGLTRTVAAGGAIAGLMSRTDSERGVWKAPAGMTADVRSILGLDLNLTDLENGVLNKQGVNCLRLFTSGVVNWGARTLDGADDFSSEWKYVPVRRLALYLEESLYRGTKWVVFEPNDEPLWAQIRLNVGAFMHSLFRQGAFQGKTPREAYLVKCDKETTTQDDINRGVVNILVGFAPLKPAEFVIIQIQQLAGQIQT